MSTPAPPRSPTLITEPGALAQWLESSPTASPWNHDDGQLEAGDWLALGDDTTEAHFHKARALGVPLVRLGNLSPDQAATRLIRPEVARSLRAVPLLVRGGSVAVAMEDPGNNEALSTLDFLSRQRVRALLATPREVREAIARHYDRVEDQDIARQLGVDPTGTSAETTEQEAQRLSREKPVVRIVHGLIADAVARRASDIHLRPGENGTDVLYRIDDEMVPVRRLMRSLHPAVTSRVKVLGAMNLAEHRKPQHGRTTFTLDDGREVHIRESLGVGPEEVFHAGRGCSHCEGLGMFKRRAVYEFMVVTPRIQSLIVPGAEADRIHAAAIEEGMVPLTQAAVNLAREGLISLTEAWRVRAD